MVWVSKILGTTEGVVARAACVRGSCSCSASSHMNACHVQTVAGDVCREASPCLSSKLTDRWADQFLPLRLCRIISKHNDKHYWPTPSFPIYKAWWNMTRSSKQHFDHLFIIYYITFDYKLIIIVKYIWLWIQSYEICIIKIKI